MGRGRMFGRRLMIARGDGRMRVGVGSEREIGWVGMGRVVSGGYGV